MEEQPQRLIGDNAYDSDGLDKRLAEERSIELIAPHRLVRNRRSAPTQDGRPLRRYRRRWKVERFFAWLHNFRRLTVRWEYHAANFLGLLRLACAMILLRSFSGSVRVPDRIHKWSWPWGFLPNSAATRHNHARPRARLPVIEDVGEALGADGGGGP